MVLLNITYYVLMFMTPLLQKKVSAPNIDAASSSAESLNELKDPPHYYFFLDEHPKNDTPSTPSTTFKPNTSKTLPEVPNSLKEHPKNDIPSTSSTKTESNDLKIPPEVAYSLKERAKCKREISAVFKEDLSPEDHINHALRNLNLKDPSITGYARPYYYSLGTFLRAGAIPSVSNYCEHKAKDNIKECYDSVILMFKSYQPKQCLMLAFYDLSDKIVQQIGNRFALGYYFEVCDFYKINLVPLESKRVPYMKPYKYCDSIIKIPPEELNLNLDL